MANEFQDALDNVKSINNDSTHDTFLKKTKSIVRGSVGGVVVGVLYGWYTQKNIYVMAVIGAVAGGAINYFIKSKTA
jgi:hypothetical protein